MDPQLSCGHVAPAFGAKLCPHLFPVLQDGIAHYQWFTGRGGENDLLCQECFKEREAGNPAPVRAICQDCFEQAIGPATVVQIFVPSAISERPESFDPRLTTTALPPEAGEVDDFTPADGESRPVWMVLNRQGEIFRFDADSGACLRLAQVDVPFEPNEQLGRVRRRRLHISPRQDFAAVVVDYGVHGKVVDLRSGAVVLDLEHPDYCAYTVPFPFAFAENAAGETLAVYRTDWNRLDLRNLASGALLSDREVHCSGEKDPRGFLDYFHGNLHLSPDGERLLDDGWKWHPSGMPRLWSVAAWLENPNEPESGPSCRNPCWRDNHWDLGMTFVGPKRVAISGLGDEAWAPGFSLVDLSLPDPAHRWDPAIQEFPGPTGEFFSDGEVLYSSGPGGLSRWDLEDGCRTGHLSGFEPTRHHRGAGELAQLRDGVLLRWRMPVLSGKP